MSHCYAYRLGFHPFLAEPIRHTVSLQTAGNHIKGLTGISLFPRLVMGLGMGAKGSTVPIFAAENAPTSIRGALGELWVLLSNSDVGPS